MEDEGSQDYSTEEVLENGKGRKINGDGEDYSEENRDGVVDLDSDNADTKDVEFSEEVINIDKKDDKESGKEKSSVKGGDKKEADDEKQSKDKENKEAKKKKLPSLEEDIGITGYAGDHAGFFGIIKQRYSDFQVNEVDGDGEMIRITNQDIPDEPEEIPDAPEVIPPEITDVKIRELNRLLGVRESKEELDSKENEKSEVQEDQEMEEAEEESKEKEESKKENEGKDEENESRDEEKDTKDEKDDSADGDEKEKESPKKDDASKEKKSERNDSIENLPALTEVWINIDYTDEADIAVIHQALKAKYRGIDSICGETPDGGKYVVVRRRKAGSARRDKSGWPKSQMYTTFVLYKENVETVDAINQIAWKARIKPSSFTYAGIKDKRAKSSQLVSVKEVAPQRLWIATKNLRSVHIGNFHFREKPQRMNLQFGNHYRIVLREVDGTDDEVIEAVESLKTKGFINYYGTQPFGNNSVSMRGIGCELLKGNWQQAVNLILAPRDNDVPDLRRCHNTWKDTGDAEAALKMLCKGWESTVESQLLTGLTQMTGNDLVEALNRIPRTTRTLYLHAYQSWLWNTIASRRVKKYGLKVLPGDIVRRKGSIAEVDEIVEESNENEADSDEGKTGDDSESKPEIETTEANGQNMSGFHFLTEEEAEVADIFDVVLPLPGYNVEYPNNEIKEWYSELLEADGLTFSALKHDVKAYAARGVYRRMMVLPTNVSEKICYYRDASKPLLQSDMDKLWGLKIEDNILKEGPSRAVIVEMTLPSSSYISVALRELLRRETSWQFQAAQNMPSNVIDRSRDTSGRGSRGRGGPWKGSDRGSWKPTPWSSTWRDDRNPAWQQQGRSGGGRGSFSPWADQGSFRARDYGWSSNRVGGGGGGYGAHVTYGATNTGGWGRGDKRSWRGGDSWTNKRGRY
ncbi:pseudouridylate synthase 7 homolog [Panulirus ornatus]|uniref:pseudouridylate synthase 7 homolog n=1 Tax=Panulirus ornatus TaxID=150431 RepID=UPI003A883014